MDSLDISNPAPTSGWLMFLVYLLAIGVPVGLGAVWYAMSHRNKKRRRKRRHHSSRQHRATLAATGGLPPMRDPNQPPPGP